jgi:hypothetical protein
METARVSARFALGLGVVACSAALCGGYVGYRAGVAAGRAGGEARLAVVPAAVAGVSAGEVEALTPQPQREVPPATREMLSSSKVLLIKPPSEMFVVPPPVPAAEGQMETGGRARMLFGSSEYEVPEPSVVTAPPLRQMFGGSKVAVLEPPVTVPVARRGPYLPYGQNVVWSATAARQRRREMRSTSKIARIIFAEPEADWLNNVVSDWHEPQWGLLRFRPTPMLPPEMLDQELRRAWGRQGGL